MRARSSSPPNRRSRRRPRLARRELTAYAANLAVSLAAKQMKVDAATDQALVREFAKELSPGPGGGAKTGQDGD